MGCARDHTTCRPCPQPQASQSCTPSTAVPHLNAMPQFLTRCGFPTVPLLPPVVQSWAAGPIQSLLPRPPPRWAALTAPGPSPSCCLDEGNTLLWPHPSHGCHGHLHMDPPSPPHGPPPPSPPHGPPACQAASPEPALLLLRCTWEFQAHPLPSEFPPASSSPSLGDFHCSPSVTQA